MKKLILSLATTIIMSAPLFAQPNIVLIFCDDLNDAGGNIGGHPQAETPNIDNLQSQGVTFTNAACNAPVCGPSRGSIWSGLYPHNTGFYGYRHNDFDWENNPAISSANLLFEHFRANGYTTHGCGKLFHNGDEDYSQFDSYGPTASFGPYPWDGVSYEPWNASEKQRQGHPQLPPGLSDGWASGIAPLSMIPSYPGYTGWIDYNAAFNWVSNSNRDQMPDEKNTDYAATVFNDTHTSPFFLAVGYNRPHTPHYAPDEYFDMYPLDSIQLAPWMANDLDDVVTTLVNNGHLHGTGKYKYDLLTDLSKDSADTEYWLKRWTQGYLACVSFVDHEIGRLLDSLAASPVASNTVVILTSDHGYHMREKNYFFKYTLWEESSRVPMVVMGPGYGVNQTVSQPVSLIDVYPTLIDIAGIPNPSNQTLDGHSMKSLFENPGAGTWTGPPVTLTSIASEDDIAVDEEADPQRQHHSVRSDRYRYTLTSAGEEELYDHDLDPHEWTNLAKSPSYDSVRLAMKAELLSLTGITDPTSADEFIFFNGNFEMGMNGWSRNANNGAVGTYSVDSATQQEGAMALRFNVTSLGANPWDAQAVNSNLKLIQDSTYNISFWARSAVSGGQFDLKIGKNSTPYNDYVAKSYTLTSTWTKYQFSFQSILTEHLDNRLLIQYLSTGDFYVDDIKIEFANGAPFLETAICNEGFENDYTGWNHWTNDGAVGTFSIDMVDPHGGVKCSKFDYTTPGTNPWSVQMVGCNTNQVAGTQYEVKFWAKVDAGPTDLKFFMGKASAPWTNEFEETRSITTTWTEFSHIYTAASTYVGDVRIKFQFENTGVFYIDDVSITDITLTGNAPQSINGLSISPNPAFDVIHVNIPAGTDAESVEVFDLSGRRLISQSGSQTLNVSNLTPGLYNIKVTTDSGYSTLKFIKE